MRVSRVIVAPTFTNSLNFLPNLSLVGQTLVIKAFREQFVEVKVVLDEKFDVGSTKLQRCVTEDVRVREAVEVERTRDVGLALRVPFKRGNSNLEGYHTLYSVLNFLISSLRLVKAVHDVGVAHRQARKFSIQSDKVATFHRFDDEVESLSEIRLHNIHSLICIINNISVR